MTNDDFVICTMADNDYFQYLEKLVLSAGIYAQNARIYVVLLNVPKEKAEYLKVLNPKVELEFEYFYFDDLETLRGYCVNRRVSIYHEQMQKHDLPLMWVDADSVFTRDAKEIAEIVKKYDLCTVFDQDHYKLKLSESELSKLPKGPLGSPFYGIFSTGISFTNNSPIAKELFNNMYELLKTNPYAWYADQEGLYLSFLKFKDKIAFFPLPKTIAGEDRYEALLCYARGDKKDGVYRSIALSLMWNRFDMQENISIDYDLVKKGLHNITNIRLTYRIKNNLIEGKKKMMATALKLTRLTNKPKGSLKNFVDWYFSKLILRKRYIKRKIHSFEMFLDTKVPGISKTLAVYRKREEDMTQLISRILKPGMTVLDCGSNIGYYPLLEAATVKESGRIICIEPDPRNFDLLKKNIEQSPYSKIFDLHHMAISSAQGEVTMDITHYSNLNKVNIHNKSGYKIKSDSVDNLLKANNWDLDLMRMDIEGHEVDVFKGMRNSLTKFKSGFTVFLEVHPNEYSATNDFAAELRHFFENGFYCRYLVSAGKPLPAAYAKLGYRPSETILSDGLERGIYTGIDNVDHIISLTCDMPKSSRYIMITKK